MNARLNDPITSHMASYDVKHRAPTQRQRLLWAFEKHPDGLTDEQAAIIAGLSMRSCWWKRCSELRAEGLIEDTGLMRVGSAGSMQMVSRIVPQITGVTP